MVEISRVIRRLATVMALVPVISAPCAVHELKRAWLWSPVVGVRRAIACDGVAGASRMGFRPNAMVRGAILHSTARSSSVLAGLAVAAYRTTCAHRLKDRSAQTRRWGATPRRRTYGYGAGIAVGWRDLRVAVG